MKLYQMSCQIMKVYQMPCQITIAHVSRTHMSYGNDWSDMVCNIEPTASSYNAATNVTLEKDIAYVFQLVSFVGKTIIPNEEEDFLIFGPIDNEGKSNLCILVKIQDSVLFCQH